jgi:methyl-accepting chemotaxis protein-1 (serine sensor receptor)
MKVVTSLFLILAILGLLELSSGGMFYHSLRQDQQYFSGYQDIRDEQAALYASWLELVQTRNTLNRAGIRILMDANKTGTGPTVDELSTEAQATLTRSEQSITVFAAKPLFSGQDESVIKTVKQQFDSLHSALVDLNNSLAKGDISATVSLDQKAQELQNNFEDAFNRYLAMNAHVFSDSTEQSGQAYTQSVSVLGGVLILVVLLILLAWVSLRRILLVPLNQIIDHIRGIADGDLTHEIAAGSQNEMGKLAGSLRDMQQSLAGTVHSVRESAVTIYSGAGEIVTGNSNLSSRTEQQASALEETAASMEQLTATVKQNAENARQAKQLAVSASETALKGGKVVDNVVKTMHEIAGSSQKIADITGVIDGIAFQTNILALNAAVEAARAGEQGRGFAVVAGEVRNLAQRSAQAAKEIKGLIDDSVTRVDVGSTLVESAGETMSEIVTAVTRVTDIMGEIASASDEQSRGIEQVGDAVAEMDTATQQNASLVQQSAAAAAVLEKQAGILTQAVSVFKLPNQPLTREGRAPLTVLPAILPNSQATTPAKSPKKTTDATSPENWETF